MNIYIVRHAQSKRNARKKAGLDVELTSVGVEQARRLGSYFKDVELGVVYCSTLKRAKETLEKIKPFIKDIPINYTSDIVEYNMGVYSNNGKDDWDKFGEKVRKIGIPFEKFKPKNGESLTECYNRAGEFYKKLLKDNKNKNILIVGHGIFSLYFILYALGLPPSEGAYYHLNNASISTLTLDKDGRIKDFHINDYNQLIKEAVKMKNEGLK